MRLLFTMAYLPNRNSNTIRNGMVEKVGIGVNRLAL